MVRTFFENPARPRTHGAVDILLLSGRDGGAAPHPSRTAAAVLTRALGQAGHDVRWICPILPGDAPPSGIDGAVVLPVFSRAAQFAAIERRLTDVPTDCALTEAIRERLPDVVHILSFGGVSTAASVWIADRMGAPVITSVDGAELLCHRGTLINEHGATCSAWNRPERCVECCMSPGAGGLTAGEAARGRLFSWLGRWSPYPKAISFRNRLDLLVSSLGWAEQIIVRSDRDRELLRQAGLPARPIRVVEAADDLEVLPRLYAEVLANHSATAD